MDEYDTGGEEIPKSTAYVMVVLIFVLDKCYKSKNIHKIGRIPIVIRRPLRDFLKIAKNYNYIKKILK